MAVVVLVVDVAVVVVVAASIAKAFGQQDILYRLVKRQYGLVKRQGVGFLRNWPQTKGIRWSIEYEAEQD